MWGRAACARTRARTRQNLRAPARMQLQCAAGAAQLSEADGSDNEKHRRRSQGCIKAWRRAAGRATPLLACARRAAPGAIDRCCVQVPPRAAGRWQMHSSCVYLQVNGQRKKRAQTEPRRPHSKATHRLHRRFLPAQAAAIGFAFERWTEGGGAKQLTIRSIRSDHESDHRGEINEILPDHRQLARCLVPAAHQRHRRRPPARHHIHAAAPALG